MAIVALAPWPALAQINLSATAGTPAASYPTLKGAFDAINAGTHQGAIAISVTGNTTELATAVLAASGSGAATYSGVVITPSGGATRVIGGSLDAPLIDLDGADNVTINGLNSGGNALILTNLDTSATASTLRLINDASNNNISNVTLRGSGTDTTQGVVLFSTGTTTGNDNNSVSDCSIVQAAGGTPTNGVVSIGSPAPAENSGNTIGNCDVANFFNASTATVGILIGSGNTQWTVNNNRLFQSVPRTYTTANVHSGIQIASGADHIISGNRIGFSSGAGTGVYTMLGTIATRLIAIDINLTAAAPVSVQGNTVSGISLATSSGATTTFGVLCGINITGGSASVGTVTPNIIGGASGVDLLTVTSLTSGALLAGIHTSSPDAVTIQNNTIGGLSSSGTTATVAGSVTGINVSGSTASLTIIGNTLGNPSANNLRGGISGFTTGSSLVSGINFATVLPSGTVSVANNTLENLASFGTGTTGFVRGIWTVGAQGPSTVFTISNNTIRNLVTNSTSTSIANGGAGAVGIVLGFGMNSIIADNVISNIARTNTGATGGFTVGIAGANATRTTITRNRISGLSNSSTSTTLTAPGIVAGVVIRSGNFSVTVSNNMIALGAGQTTNTAFIGIQANHGSAPDPLDQIYFNTIQISGTAGFGSIPSFGFLRGDLTASARNQTIDFRNNLITNTRNGGTGAHFAIANNFGATASNTGWPVNASNFNVLNADAATVGHWNGNLSFAGWKTASAGDGSSTSGIAVNFTNPAIGDLHLNMGVTPTQIESGGTPIESTTVDFDQQVRPGPVGSVNGGAFAPDIGADEFDGTYLDVIAPNIVYAALPNTTFTADRTLSATISDFSGVATGGVAPRIYYRKNAGALFSRACTLASGTVFSGTWSCTISHADLAGVVTNDVVQYFVVAQDISGSLGANPGDGFVGTNVNVVTTPPSTPSQYTIATAFSGVYSVGAGEVFTSLTNAGGVFEAINNGVLTGNVTFNITSDLSAETGAVALNQWIEEAGGGYTLKIKPSAGPRSVVGSFNGALIRLNGADRVTIDGSTIESTANGQIGGDAALRELSFQNTSVGTSAVVIHLGTGSNGSQNNRLRNLNLSGQDPSLNLIVVSIGGNTPGTAGADNDNNVVENCAFKRATFGLVSIGQDAANPNTGTVLVMNDLSATGVDRIRRVGILVDADSGGSVAFNHIGGMDSGDGQDAFGIALGTLTISATATTAGGVTNALVQRNRINGVAQTGTFSAAGIAIAGGTVGQNTIVNNMISGVTSNSTSPDLSAGIFVAGTSGSRTRVWSNSVLMSGDRGATATWPSFGIAISGTDPMVEVKNNSFATTQVATGAATNPRSYAIGLGSATFANLDANFNNYFASGANAGFFRSGSLDAGSGTDYATVAAWAAAVSDDANSIQQDPVYVSDSDLHLQTTSPLIATGTNVSGISNDFDNQARSPTSPCIGADEIIDADVQIDKSNGVAGLLNGQSTVYAIVVANAGPVAANGASVTDTLPSTLINGSWACVQAQSTATCPTPDAGVGNLASTVNLNVGQHLRFDVLGTVDGSVGAFVTNTASVAVPNTLNDPTPGNNSATDQDPILSIGIFADGFENSSRSNLTVPGAVAEMGQ